MRPYPEVVFSPHSYLGLTASSGWEQVEARAVLRDIGWQWDDHVHALIPPDDADPADAGVHAVVELHARGFQIGYPGGPYGAMPLRRRQAEQIFATLSMQEAWPSGSRPAIPPRSETVQYPKVPIHFEHDTALQDSPPEL